MLVEQKKIAFLIDKICTVLIPMHESLNSELWKKRVLISFDGSRVCVCAEHCVCVSDFCIRFIENKKERKIKIQRKIHNGNAIWGNVMDIIVSERPNRYSQVTARAAVAVAVATNTGVVPAAAFC